MIFYIYVLYRYETFGKTHLFFVFFNQQSKSRSKVPNIGEGNQNLQFNDT